VNLADRRAQIAGAVNGIGGLRAYDYPPADVVPPAAVVEPEEVDYRGKGTGFGAGGEWQFSVFVLISPADAEGAARQTDAFFDRSFKDLKAAIEAVDDEGQIEVTGADRWGEYPIGGRSLAGFRLLVEVLD
jgi:hypothetical protein